MTDDWHYPQRPNPTVRMVILIIFAVFIAGIVIFAAFSALAGVVKP